MTIDITPGHVLRHTPPGARAQGREAALVDIAQDLLLREWHARGLMDMLVFKGGTSLRKFYAGNSGRFSLDLDFSLNEIGVATETVLDLLVEQTNDLTLGPFAYTMTEKRGKKYLHITSDRLGSSESLSSKLDVSAPPWLAPTTRSWVRMPIHATYGDALPALPVIRLEENLAEKISRLNRGTPARDMYDLGWIADNLLRTTLDAAMIRRLAVLKVWVDTHGVTAGAGEGNGGCIWRPAHSGGAFEASHWLRSRSPREYDEEDIGTLAVPAPDLSDLSSNVRQAYNFLADLDQDEAAVAKAREQDRPLVLRMLTELPGHRLANIGLF